MCSSSLVFDLSKMAYLYAKNAPTTNPGIEVISIEAPPIDRASRIAKPPEENEAIISIRIADFVTANPSELRFDSICGFLS